MSQIDIGGAATAGFRIIGRQPVAVLVWGLTIFALGVIPLFLMFGALAPAFAEIMRTMPENGEPDMRTMMQLQGQLMAVNSLVTLSSLVVRVLVMCAIFRAVLEPAENRLFYLRLGMAEVMAGLMMLFVGILVAFGAVGAVLVLALVVAGVAAASPEAGVIVGIVAVLTLIVGIIWAALRMSLAPVMAFATRGFPIVETFQLTKGRVGSLFLVALLSFLIVLVVELVLGGVLVGIAVGVVMASPPDEAAMQAFFSQPPAVWMTQLAPWALLAGLVFSLLGAAFMTLMVAPWAAAYRDLVPAETPAETFA